MSKLTASEYCSKVTLFHVLQKGEEEIPAARLLPRPQIQPINSSSKSYPFHVISWKAFHKYLSDADSLNGRRDKPSPPSVSRDT